MESFPLASSIFSLQNVKFSRFPARNACSLFRLERAYRDCIALVLFHFPCILARLVKNTFDCIQIKMCLLDWVANIFSEKNSIFQNKVGIKNIGLVSIVKNYIFALFAILI